MTIPQLGFNFTTINRQIAHGEQGLPINASFGSGRYVSAPLGQDSVSFSSNPDNEQKKKSNAVKIAIGLGALAGIVIATAAILKGRGKASKFEKNVAKGIEEAYGEYAPIFEKAGVKDIPKPMVNINKTASGSELAFYRNGMNVIDVNENKLADFVKNKCFLVDKSGNVVLVRVSDTNGANKYYHVRTVFSKDCPNLQEIAKAFDAEIRYFDERIFEPFTDGVVRHEMRHWVQNMVTMNSPKTFAEQHRLYQEFDRSAIAKLRAMGVKDFIDYKPANVDIELLRKTKQGEIVYRAEDFIKHDTAKSGSVEYHTSPAEIDANWAAHRLLRKKYKDVTDKDLRLQLDALDGFFLEHDPYNWTMNGKNPVGFEAIKG